MNDLISRRAAIDAIKALWDGAPTAQHVSAMFDCEDAIQALPPAQPEQPSEIQDILEYLDTALHPIISPEHWSVYSELHDMISTLPSAQPEHGRWDLIDACEPMRYGCSVCHRMVWHHENYCPNCGAKMDEVGE